jgi:phage regulator Rha-like protein
LSHDGFALLVMGFTGKEALAWKVKFLAAFRYMEGIVANRTKRAESALFQLKPHWKTIRDCNEMSREWLIRKTGHRSPNTITANRRRMRQVGLIR